MRIIRTTLMVLAILVGVTRAAGGANPFVGDWRGTMATEQRPVKVPVRVSVGENSATHYFCTDGKWVTGGKKRLWFGWQNNNALLSWIDTGGLWTETQTFSLSYVNTDTVSLVWTRHVNNKKESTDNTTWHTFGGGTLRKSADSSEGCERTSR